MDHHESCKIFLPWYNIDTDEVDYDCSIRGDTWTKVSMILFVIQMVITTFSVIFKKHKDDPKVYIDFFMLLEVRVDQKWPQNPILSCFKPVLAFF